mgnify:CR=1
MLNDVRCWRFGTGEGEMLTNVDRGREERGWMRWWMGSSEDFSGGSLWIYENNVLILWFGIGH